MVGGRGGHWAPKGVAEHHGVERSDQRGRHVTAKLAGRRKPAIVRLCVEAHSHSCLVEGDRSEQITQKIRETAAAALLPAERDRRFLLLHVAEGGSDERRNRWAGEHISWHSNRRGAARSILRRSPPPAAAPEGRGDERIDKRRGRGSKKLAGAASRSRVAAISITAGPHLQRSGAPSYRKASANSRRQRRRARDSGGPTESAQLLQLEFLFCDVV